ncbi:hypothetical protein F4775DRAFT_554938 [Biscogniauxia sp. FL1348]|nr:hypothetical protein F4775DRAFT_554938 [Biscogniauxia sp. FL1348]
MASDENRNIMAELPSDLPPIPDGEFCIYATAYAYPEHADALESALAETTRLAQSEPGCVHYSVSRDDEDPTVFHIFERYRSREAFEQHMQHPPLQKLPTYARDIKAKCVKPLLPK